MSKAFPHFIGVDNGHHWGTAGADVAVKTCEDLSIFAGQSMDFVFSSHLLEHIQDTKAALKEWWRVLKVGGRLVLYLPHKDLYPNCGTPGANPDHKHDFMPEDIEGIMKEIGGWDMLRNETRAETNEYSVFSMVLIGSWQATSIATPTANRSRPKPLAWSVMGRLATLSRPQASCRY
jgi:SAM-dependent methyltransferase